MPNKVITIQMAVRIIERALATWETSSGSDVLIDAVQAANALGVSRGYIRRCARDGRLKSVEPRSNRVRHLFRLQDLIAFAIDRSSNQQRRKSTPERRTKGSNADRNK